VLGSALLVTLASLIAFGLGAIIRHTAGAIASAIGLLFIVQLIVAFLPNTWRSDVIRFLPSSAGRVISSTVGPSDPHLWSAWPQLLVTVVWAVVLVAVGGYLFRKRDA
jgi:ABC-2 type transport system permease protein